ncbi:MAG: glycosyltransferase family 39 protein, partial [Anaerolineae bacterium]
MARSKRTWLLAGIVGLAFALRVAGLDFQSLWRDEVDAIRFATTAWGDLLRMFVVPGQNGPLYYLALRPWLYLAGTSEYALRLFSVLFGTLAVPLVYRLSRRLFPSPPSLALVATLLAATSPYLVWYSQEGKMYSLVLALVLLSMDRYLAALERGGW